MELYPSLDVRLRMPPLPRPSQLGKFAALVSSIVIVGFYVAYRSGGQTTTTTSLPGSKGGVVRLNGATTAVAATNPTSAPAIVPISPELIISASSKSGRVFTPQVISGSKSAAVFQPSETNITFLTTQPTTAPSQPPPQTTANQPSSPVQQEKQP